MALQNHLRELSSMYSTVIQYVDDILLASETEEQHEQDLRTLLDHLHQEGHKASIDKAQITQGEVVYLGQKISKGKRELTQDRTAAIRAAKQPTTIQELRSFLGLCNFNRNWIDSYTQLAQPLTDFLKGKQASKVSVTLTKEEKEAFENLKRALCSVPALGIPDNGKPYTLLGHEKEGYMTAILTQEHGDKQRPIGYYSKKLDTVALGWGSCLRAMEATCQAVMATAGLVLDQKLTLSVRTQSILCYP
ncbi:retrovirus-related Pol polyprotein from transposon opus isoform X2 [Heterodontus francisci]|uniref:retrovirus-related Pol polyprotein from transposon opus isoform X2 n=1 Tax=Heterodontus francisci TaxID=7792 RepID=UPI00355C016B